MKFFKIIFWPLAAILLVGACKSQYDALLNSNDVDAKFKAAFDYFNAGKYQKAASLFESLAILTSGTDRDDTVQYYWGYSNYKFKDFYTAESNLAKFVETFPRSVFTESARFMRVDCLYKSTLRYELDPSPTYKAISAINEYVRDYPESDHIDDCLKMLRDLGGRLHRKAYEAARLYYHMEDYLAARVALKNVLKDDAENIYRENILYYIAMSSYKFANLSVAAKQKERYLTFIDDYLNFVGEMPDSPYRKELDALYRRAQRAIGNYAGIPKEEAELDEKAFEKDRKKALKAKKIEDDKKMKQGE